LKTAVAARVIAAAANVKRLKDLASLALVAAVTLVVGVLNHSFTGFPKGYDAFGHMSKIKLLVDYFPNADWNYEWYAGMLFSGSFPPLFHYIGALLAVVLGISTATALVVIAAASFVVIGWGLYGLVRTATGDHMAALISVLILTSSAGYWTYIVEGGLYPRILGMAFMALFGFFAILYYRRGGRAAYVAMVLSLAATLSSHLLLGAIAVAFALLIIMALPRPAGDRIREALKLLAPTALVVAYFYLPYAYSLQGPAPVPLLTREYKPLPLSALFVPGMPGGQFESLPFFLLPAAIALPLPAYATGRLPLQPLTRRLMLVVSIAAAASLAYAFVGLPAPSLFIDNFQPGQALFFATWFLAALIGLTLSGLRLPRAATAGLIVVLLAFILITAPDVARGAVNGDNSITGDLQAALKVDPSERQYRVGVSWDGGSVWINSISDVPQTRGYQQQGVLHADWQYWFEQTVWNRASNYAETDFLLDWYAVKSLYGGPDAAVVQRYEARPDLYAPLSPSLPMSARTFEYLNATPILSARSTRTALVVGDDASYTLIVKAISLSGFDSRSLIPVEGGEYLDDYSAAELAQFDEIILYGYKVHDRAKALALLDDYVQHGGGVVMEANNSPFDQTDSAQEPIPGAQIKKIGIGPAWQLESRPSPITSGIDLGAFAPAVYQGGPWGISYIPPSLVRSWAEPVLLSDGRPVLVAGTLGQGRVVWSGLNLPYHIVSNQTDVESRLLSQEITWASPNEAIDPAYTATFVNPQLSRITITSSATGVLFKESWDANWHANINGNSAPVYEAGPGFMYVPLGKNVAYPAQVTLEFTRSSVEWVGDGVSVVAVVGLLAYAFADLRRRRWRRRRALPSASH
jgi:hypothetical protein